MPDTDPRKLAPKRDPATTCPDALCPACGSEELTSVKSKLVCSRCRTIVMTCCEF